MQGLEMDKPFIQLAFDCPTNWLGFIQPLVDFDWILADKALSDDNYLSFFKNSTKPKIIDNRKKGTGEPIELDKLKKVWDQLGGVVVAPDWFGDHARTISAFGECEKLFGRDNVMGVAQVNEPSAINEYLYTYSGKIAISYDVGSTHEDPYWVKICRRALTIHSLQEREVHLLGFVTLLELDLYKHCPNITSLNTGMPIWLAFSGKRIETYQENKRGDAYNLMDMDNTPIGFSNSDLVRHNIAELRKKTRSLCC